MNRIFKSFIINNLYIIIPIGTIGDFLPLEQWGVGNNSGYKIIFPGAFVIYKDTEDIGVNIYFF